MFCWLLMVITELPRSLGKICASVQDCRSSFGARVQLSVARVFNDIFRLLLTGLTLLLGTQALKPPERLTAWHGAVSSGLGGFRCCLADYAGLVLSLASLLAVLVLKPIVGAVLGTLVGAFLAGLAAVDSLFNYRGMLDGLLALGLRLGLAGVEGLAKAGNFGGVLDDVLGTVLAMFDDYLRYRELRAASARGAAGMKSKQPKGHDHEPKEEARQAERARQRSGSEGTGEADAQEPTQ